MMHEVSISGDVLIVGAPDILTACLYTPLSEQLNAVAATELTLHEMVVAADTIVADYAVVLFETNASEDDLNALARFVEVADGKTKFIALVDDNLPLTKVRQLGTSGAAEVLPIETRGEALVQVLADLTKVPEPVSSPVGLSAKIFSVAQSRGGAGATTIAVNLATSLAAPAKRGQAPARVLLLDLDLQFGNAGTYLDIEDNGGMFELIAGDELPGTQSVLGAVQSTGHGVDVLTAPSVFVPLTSMTPDLVAHIIGIYRSAYDFIIIDLPRATLDWITPAIMATDQLVMVSDGSVPCIRQAKRLVDLYRENRLTLPVELIMNREKKQFFGSETIRDAETLLGIKVGSWLPDDPSAERRAIDLGKPSALAKSKGRKEYRRLAQRLSATAKSTSNDLV